MTSPIPVPRSNTGYAFSTGPYPDGPPPEALEIEYPDITRFGLEELGRAIWITVVLVAAAIIAIVRWPIFWLRKRRRFTVSLAEGIVKGFEALGPTFVKLGQLMASSPGVFPPVLADACLRLLDKVPPVSARRARRAIERDLGGSIEDLFDSFEDVPLSAASVAQVHACVLLDGREAVVKVQRPEIRRHMRVDLRVAFAGASLLERFFEFFRIANATVIVRELNDLTAQELNSAAEALRQERFRDNLYVFGDNSHVMVPEIFWSHCGPRVICMERVRGTPVGRIMSDDLATVDSELQLRRGVKVWLEAVVLHGPFHGDVHAGNLWELDDGRVGFLDFGIVGELPEEWRDVLREMFRASLFDGNYTEAARRIRVLGITDGTTLGDKLIGLQLRKLFEPVLGRGAGRLDLSRLVASLVETGRRWGIATPEELVLFGKQLGYFERYSATLAPDWILGQDLFLFRNILPNEVAAAALARNITLPD
ncbi:ABC1 kinase family protein [Rhodococcus sp. IEGM 1330]|uniref:ABC1 kinase family protein n=1 Tax=Rhodococcus sp. IEGM 1330 TaxID=3082225 RepID=UPI002953CA20|nr:AarF/UbiB family protein [Rhodococcus sp. IEGM 1330]MDV8023501.1 AarF/UbiB family protein [Rhodococcus sp. IEGM 1330]